MDYHSKYLKYKNKYLELKKIHEQKGHGVIGMVKEKAKNLVRDCKEIKTKEFNNKKICGYRPLNNLCEFEVDKIYLITSDLGINIGLFKYKGSNKNDKDEIILNFRRINEETLKSLESENKDHQFNMNEYWFFEVGKDGKEIYYEDLKKNYTPVPYKDLKINGEYTYSGKKKFGNSGLFIDTIIIKNIDCNKVSGISVFNNTIETTTEPKEATTEPKEATTEPKEITLEPIYKYNFYEKEKEKEKEK